MDGVVIAERYAAADQAASLPALIQDVLAGHGFDLVAVTVGPGSFTGLRASLALAHGLAIAAGVDIVGVTIGAALQHAAPAGRQLWTAIDSKRGRVFLEIDGQVQTVDLTGLPVAGRPIAVAGDAAIAVAARLAARDEDVQLLAERHAAPLGIALAAARGDTRPSLPLYVDPPAATPGPARRPPPA
jgi:tRNA threonylcarbamoyladenosine biosynthesis protein TsaB